MSIYQLQDRGIISIDGEDASSFLQSLISNDINKASPERLFYALLLTPQGKILYDFFITMQSNSYLLDVPKSHLTEIITKLTFYKLRAKVNIQPHDKILVYASQDEGFVDPRHPQLGKRLITEKIHQAGDASAYHQNRIQHLVPDFNTDLLPDTFFPLDLNLDQYNAIDYNKGCYVGQEVTARMHYRGVKRKKIYLVKLLEKVPNTFQGAAIEQDGKKIGIMLGIVGQEGLALLRDDLVQGNILYKLVIDADEMVGVTLLTVPTMNY